MPYSGSPVSCRIRTCCILVLVAIRSVTCCRTVVNYFSHGVVFSLGSALMHPSKVELIRVTFGICRTCHEGRPDALTTVSDLTPFVTFRICRTCHEGRPNALTTVSDLTPFLSMTRWEASKSMWELGRNVDWRVLR